jgi:hypothetical protein
MFLAVRVPLRLAALTTLLAAASPAPFADAANHPPSSAQIRSAVQRAKRSGALWATVNICNTRRYPDRIGIRGQMPSLGFAAALSMDIQVDYLPSGDERFTPVPGASRMIGLQSTSGLRQEGANWSFTSHTGTLSGTITFEWALDGKVLGQVTRATTAGHPDAEFASPPHFSAAHCTI